MYKCLYKFCIKKILNNLNINPEELNISNFLLNKNIANKQILFLCSTDSIEINCKDTFELYDNFVGEKHLIAFPGDVKDKRTNEIVMDSIRFINLHRNILK